jgi:TPR repeat protein
MPSHPSPARATLPDIMQRPLSLGPQRNRGLASDESHGVELLLRAGAEGFSPAYVELGYRYMEADGLALSIENAVAALRKGVELEHSHAQYLLSWCLDQHNEHQEREHEAQDLLRAAASENHPSAMWTLSMKLLGEENDYTPEYDGEARDLLEKAAETQHPPAMTTLGRNLLTGENFEQSTNEGRSWLRKAIESDYSPAKFILADWLLDQQDDKENVAKAEQLLRSAAEDGNVNAQYRLGLGLLREGWISEDIGSGLRYLERARSDGHPAATFQLGVYACEIASNRNERRKAVRLLEQAVEKDFIPAMRFLGVALFDGDRLPRNRSRGIELLRQAIKEGDTSAKAHLARCLYQSELRKGDNKDKSAMDEIGQLLLKAHSEDSDRTTKNNLAYVLRRGELSHPTPDISVVDLLREGVEEEEPFCIVNEALRIADGIECESNWEVADDLIHQHLSADGAAEVQGWWQDLAKAGDSEGELVLGWLARHQLVRDPTGDSPKLRFDRARDSHWKVPRWMDAVVEI